MTEQSAHYGTVCTTQGRKEVHRDSACSFHAAPHLQAVTGLKELAFECLHKSCGDRREANHPLNVFLSPFPRRRVCGSLCAGESEGMAMSVTTT